MLLNPLIQKFKVEILRLNTKRTAMASIETPGTETWDFSGGDTVLNVTIDTVVQAVNILMAGFAVPAAATAAELVVILNAGLATGEAYATPGGAVVLSSDIIGVGGSVVVTGGSANVILQFPTQTVTDGGYDPIRGGMRPVPDGSQAGQAARREHEAVTLRCQVDRGSWGAQRLGAGGLEESADVVLTLNRRELIAEGLIYATGKPRLNPGDRIYRILSLDDVLQEQFDDPELHVVQVERAGFGLALNKRRFNLVYLHCAYDRKGQ